LLGRRSSSPSARAGYLGVFALLLLAGCSRGSVWRIPLEEFRSRLLGGNHDFLRHVDYKSADTREVARIGPQAPYYLGIIYRSLSMPQMERRMVELGCRVSRGIAREECEARYIELLIGDGKHEEALRRLPGAISRGKDGRRAAHLRRLRIEALFALGRDQELLTAVSQELELAPDPAALRRDDAELAFFDAAASARLERPEWEEQFRALAWGYRASPAHQRALAFLEASADRTARFSPSEMELFRGKAALAAGRSQSAADLLRHALGLLSPPSGSVVVEEAARLFLALDRYEEGLEMLRSVRLRATEPWVVDEFEGRILRAAGSPAEAALALEKSFRSSPEAGQRQRALWHYLDIRIQAGERGIGAILSNRREFVTDGSYYEDLLEEALSAALEHRDWRDLETIRDFCREKNIREALARADFIIARAVASRLLAASASREPGSLLDEALAADPGGYYGLLAGRLRQRPYERLSIVEEAGGIADGSVRPSSAAAREAGGVAGEYVEGFFLYGLPLEGYRAAESFGSSLPEDAVLDAAQRLQGLGYAAESIRLAATLARREGAPLTLRRLRLLYPALFISDIEQVALERDLPVPAVFGLVREESLFDPDIVSRAGAVGLTQLMPATAEEVGSRLGLGPLDLTEPLTSIRIGLRHLAGLRSATSSLAKAIIAYNAGLGRLRGWERELGAFPEELFVEAVPYSETRLYLRQVIISAVSYGALYYHAAPAETVGLFYPGLVPPAAP
jgi:soluble lytic murein transglycosylase-like protein